MIEVENVFRAIRMPSKAPVEGWKATPSSFDLETNHYLVDNFLAFIKEYENLAK